MDASNVETVPVRPATPQLTRDQAVALLKANQNFALAIPAGIVAAIVGAAIWGAVVYATNMEIGLIAVALGALVGYAIRTVGKGVDLKFGILGAACAAFGWALGTLASLVAAIAQAKDMPMLDVVSQLDVDKIGRLMSATAQPLDFLFLAIAVYEGFKLSFKYRLK